jgi:hypothetical protein
MNPEKTLATGPELSGMTPPASDARCASGTAPDSPPAPHLSTGPGRIRPHLRSFPSLPRTRPSAPLWSRRPEGWRLPSHRAPLGQRLRLKGRIATYTAQCAERSTQFESGLQQEEILDATARARAMKATEFAGARPGPWPKAAKSGQKRPKAAKSGQKWPKVFGFRILEFCPGAI